TLGSRKSGTQCCTGRSPCARRRSRREAMRCCDVRGFAFFGVVAMARRNMLRNLIQWRSRVKGSGEKLSADFSEISGEKSYAICSPERTMKHSFKCYGQLEGQLQMETMIRDGSRRLDFALIFGSP